MASSTATIRPVPFSSLGVRSQAPCRPTSRRDGHRLVATCCCCFQPFAAAFRATTQCCEIRYGRSVTLCLPTGLSRSLPLPLALWSPCVLESAWLAASMPVQRLYFCFLRVHSVVVANPRNLPTALLFLLQILEVIGRELSLPAASDIVLSH